METVAQTRRRPWPHLTRATAAVLGAVAVVALSACGAGTGDSTSPTAGASLDDLAGRTFAVSSVTRDGAEAPLVKGTTVTLGFGSDGQLSANAGCNSMSGPVSLDAGTLVVDQLASTEMACADAIMKQEQWWGTLLSGSPTLVVDGTTLTLTGGGDVVTLEEQPATPDQPLAGTDWRLTSLLSMVGRNDGSVSSVPKGVDASLLFGKDGKVNGSAGCNSIGGAYTVDGDRITFQQLATTLMACEGPRGEVEHDVLAVLNGPVTYTIQGDQLTLVNADIDSGLGYTAVQGG